MGNIKKVGARGVATKSGRRNKLVKLGSDFYERPSVVKVAKELLGKVLVTDFGGARTSGRIVEVEAYNGVVDRASHAWSGRRTARTEVMFGAGGRAYVYLIYGIHSLFNVVTNTKDIPHAVLVRALQPLDGIAVMEARMGRVGAQALGRRDEVRVPGGLDEASTRAGRTDYSLTRGPGNLSRAMGLMREHTGLSLLGKEIWIADDGYTVRPSEIVATTRIGVEYAGEDAALRYRFFLKGNPWVSGPKRLNAG
ncbi:MAG TPA: DNA-3-methyladenine glycosylase [Puia sp.]|nr:DNA-3-methyladenine glycosylase [Puia sp.]